MLAAAVDALEPRRLFAAFSAATDFVVEDVATYPDGRILAVGYDVSGGGQRQDVLRRFKADGSPDDSFGNNGRVRNGVTAESDSFAVVIQSDDPDDPNRHSCGSFFLNPILRAVDADGVTARAGDPAMPRWSQPDGRVKLSAAWLIERAGFARGARAGSVGLSSQHTLAIVAHEGARARDVIAFARRVQDAVDARFGVKLTPEPVFWGV